MKNKIVETLWYGFLAGLCLNILFLSRQESVEVKGTYTITVLTLDEYIFKILRYSIWFALIIGAIYFLYCKFRKQ
ncbi:hypothetical protein EEL30_00260 (plasmid) [Brevibacillus laterosporus]|uniref:Uncharacterized protein n=1 Tax=Brevibacillus laterosporus TaxID=1465 RepID=A0A518V1T1_BRELA|nr:hypothetical protein EEL30_00260 [Brevibacillus laterosporus]